MTFSWARVRAIFHKELRDYRHNRFVIATMAILPLIFIIAPTIQILTTKASIGSAKLDTRIGISLLYMLIVPAMVPSALAAYSVVGEREQGTLEPVLITPIRREEFLIGRALAVLVPTLGIAYAVFGIFLGVAVIFAQPGVASAVFEGFHLPSNCCSRRYLPAGRSGSASRSPRALSTCAPPSSSACSAAFPRSASWR